MTFTPQGYFMLIQNIPWNETYKDVVSFANATAQQSYFSSLNYGGYSQVTYMQKDEIIRVDENIEDLYDVNYVAYINNNKWIYAFIIDKQWKSPSCTEIKIKTDVYQTYMFDMQLQQSFVVREHVTDDTIGKNLVDEGLEYGEWINKHYSWYNGMNELAYVLAYSDGWLKDWNNTLGAPQFGGLYGNIYSALRYKVFLKNDTALLNTYIQAFAENGKIDAITSIFAIPLMFLPSGVTSADEIPYGATEGADEFTIDYDASNIDGYTPKNKKLFCYPYNYLYVSNQNGNNATFKFEYFSTVLNGDGAFAPVFRIGGNIAPNPQGYLVPLNYKGAVANTEEMLTIGGFPLCSWKNDVYANWLAQNSASMGVNLLGNMLNIGTGLAMGNPMGMASGIQGIASQMAQIYERSVQPDQARGNTSSGSLNCAMGINTFHFYHRCIKSEYAQRLDKYFDMFGYKVNTVKVPNTSSRPYWNFVQTIDMSIKGAIPQPDLIELESIFNKGVTIWHSASNIRNYSLNNH